MKLESQNLKRAVSRIKSFFSAHRKATFALIVSLALAYVGWLFYNYALRLPAFSADQIEKKVSIDLTLYQKVVEELARRQANFDAEPGRIYQDPFR